MTGYLLDTDTCIYALKQVQGVLEVMLARPRESIHVSVITESELRFGVAKSRAAARSLRLLENFLHPLRVVPVESEDAIVYARVRAGLERKGKPIGTLDTFIAAQALRHGLTLVTNNRREFGRVPGLDVENWVS